MVNRISARTARQSDEPRSALVERLGRLYDNRSALLAEMHYLREGQEPQSPYELIESDQRIARLRIYFQLNQHGIRRVRRELQERAASTFGIEIFSTNDSGVEFIASP